MQTQVYFAECSGRIKIGITAHVKARLSQLRTGSAAPVTLIASVKGSASMEQALHKKLKPFRIDREWYRDCADVRAAIQNSINNFPAGETVAASRKNRGQKFAAVARALWPVKTSANLAVIAGSNERTAKRWLSGEFEPPAIVIAAVIVEITKRE